MNKKSLGALVLIASLPVAHVVAQTEAAPATNPAPPLLTAAPPLATGSQSPPGDEPLRLDFRDQPLPVVLSWLAEKSNLNLDWQQLPEGTVNLVSSKVYTLSEAHDLINMQLLARGFTLLVNGEVLRVVKLEGLDPTLVPRVEPEELAELPAHQFARVSFPMNWMIADEAAGEFEALLSRYGKLHPMTSTNRLEAVDAVVNLRALNRLLIQAERDESRRERVEEFAMKHRRAEEIAPKVRQLLGLPATEVATSGKPTQLDLETTKLRSEAVKQLGADAKPLLQDKPDIHLIVNDEENSIIVHARSDRIEIARQAIEALDKPLPAKKDAWSRLSNMRTHEVRGFNVATFLQFVEDLQEERRISEETRVDHEAPFNRIVVFGPPEDQLTIANLLQGLKTESRQAEVISLVSLDPHYAAKAVQTVLKNPTRPSAVPGVQSDGKFQIEPDPNNNRLLLWATPKETEEVRQFLAQLGESFVAADITQRLHVVATNGVPLGALQGSLEQMWSRVSDAPLEIKTSPTTDEDAPPEPADAEPPKDPSAAHEVPPPSKSIALTAAMSLVTQLAPPAAGEGVQLIEGEDGKVVIASKDPSNAAAAKALLEGLLPQNPNLKVVKLEHAEAEEVQQQLSSVLSQTDSNPDSPLAPKQDFSIEVDSRSNSLIVQNVSQEQASLIDKMTPVLDAPTPVDPEFERVQRIYQVRYADASELAETVKEVYRDLLSRSDKSFTRNNSRNSLGYAGPTTNTKRKEPQYQGLLAISPDADSNKLIISAPAYLMDELMDLVERLDTGPADSSIGVVQLTPNMDSEAIAKALGAVLEKRKGD